MYHAKKICLLISHIMGEYQKNLCQGVLDKALEYGYSVEVYASMDGEPLGEYGQGEFSILNIPNYNDFSGVIFASDTYLLPELKERIYSSLKQNCQCPVIDITLLNETFPSVSLDNNHTAYHLTKHLIKEHHCKRICYLGCSQESFFSDLRKEYYHKAMSEAGLDVGSNDIYNGLYSAQSAEIALNQFKTGDTLPDAVVCYNDKMALLFMQKAMEYGYRIPEDFAVTGCDSTPEGQNTIPSLTTVTFPVQELGTIAVENLICAIRKEPFPPKTTLQAEPVFRHSCGCVVEDSANPFLYNQSLTKRIDSIESSILSSMRMSAAFQRIQDIDEGMDLLETFISQIDHCREFYLCLYDNWDAVSPDILYLAEDIAPIQASNEVLLKLAVRDGKRLAECSFPKTGLLPEMLYKHSDSAYLCMPLYFGDKSFGYIVLAYESNRMEFPFRLVHWFMNINQMLERICEHKRSSILLTHLEDVYMRDSLTGLYNKPGYQRKEEVLLARACASQGTITAFLFDLDNLKHINDTYGHTEGDFALQVIGHALASVTQSEDICARFSGDEFYLLVADYTEKDAEDLILRVQKYLANYNNLSNKEYPIHVSGGFASTQASSETNSETIKELYRLADEKMYLQKQAHHTKNPY